MSAKCLGCYKQIAGKKSKHAYHPRCSRALFGVSDPPLVEFGARELEKMAKASLSRSLGVTGVQPKISVEVQRLDEDPTHRALVVGLWGNYILKPPSKRFPDMPVVEDLTLHLAKAANIPTVEHGLIALSSGELAYITRRFDRETRARKKTKIAVEDFCQLSGLLTERKYKTSLEKAGKILLRHSSRPGLDAVTFFDIAIFSFLTGNADMHLKNFSLMAQAGTETEMILAPAYDLVATYLMPIKDEEESALTINGKKNRLKREDFQELAQTLRIPAKAAQNSFERIEAAIPEMKQLIRLSFLSKKLQTGYEKLLRDRARRLF